MEFFALLAIIIPNMAKLLYQGHASLRITSDAGKVLYVDPYAGEGYEPTADLVLVTHEHYDHNATHIVPMSQRTIVVHSKDAFSDGIYRDFDYFGFEVHAVPAGNKNHDPSECVGFLIKVDGVLIYVAGDTDYMPFMNRLSRRGIDYAFLPIDGIYNMGPEEASRVAGIIQPKHLIPYHMKPGSLFDIRQDMRVSYERAMLVKPGDEIRLEHEE